MHSIVLAGGCFWGVEHFFRQFTALHTTAGYVNGSCTPVTYREVCEGSGHAEAVKIDYPDSICLPQILAAYFSIIDPTSLNRQGNDRGISYRTGIYTNDPMESKIAWLMLSDLQHHYAKPLQVEVRPLKNFTPAEDEHQNYLSRHPGGYCHLSPSLMHGHCLLSLPEVAKRFPSLKVLDDMCRRQKEHKEAETKTDA